MVMATLHIQKGTTLALSLHDLLCLSETRCRTLNQGTSRTPSACMELADAHLICVDSGEITLQIVDQRGARTKNTHFVQSMWNGWNCLCNSSLRNSNLLPKWRTCCSNPPSEVVNVDSNLLKFLQDPVAGPGANRTSSPKLEIAVVHRHI